MWHNSNTFSTFAACRCHVVLHSFVQLAAGWSWALTLVIRALQHVQTAVQWAASPVFEGP